MAALSATTKIHDLIEEHPFLVDFPPSVNTKYKLLANPVMRNTVGKVATITQAAAIGGMKPEKLLQAIAAGIERRTGKKPVTDAGGAYRGCLEVTQDATGIRSLSGEKRLPD